MKQIVTFIVILISFTSFAQIENKPMVLIQMPQKAVDTLNVVGTVQMLSETQALVKGHFGKVYLVDKTIAQGSLEMEREYRMFIEVDSIEKIKKHHYGNSGTLEGRLLGFRTSNRQGMKDITEMWKELGKNDKRFERDRQLNGG